MRQYLEGVFLPFARRRWKESSKGTTEHRIKYHIASELGDRTLRSFTRDQLQDFLDAKTTAKLSFSVVDHLRWDLNSMFSLAVDDGLVRTNPAAALFTPRDAKRPDKAVMSAGDVARGLAVLKLPGRVIVKLAVLAGMRPGEILALRWQCVKESHAVIQQRVYRGKVDTPKTVRSCRTVAFSASIKSDLAAWRELARDPNGWVFPSERLTTPLWRDNVWKRSIAPIWSRIGLGWATFQVMRRTHATLAKEAGADPKVTADQMGHGVGVNLDEYTRSRLPQLTEVANRVESMLPEANTLQRMDPVNELPV
jgi:integrase